MQKIANRLIKEQSPYLLQHAYNPVDWHPWDKDTLSKALSEDKPIILSIGYAACHWCHVMERESFENDKIAELMNRHFICIKVDREERPDIDQIYMDAVQRMGLQGGWPLNVFLMPDGKPFYGGTYFQPQQWANLLGQVAKAFQQNRTELLSSAESFAASLQQDELSSFQANESQDKADGRALIEQMIGALSNKFDTDKGGMDRSPKFPMPCIYNFLLHAGQTIKQEQAIEHTLFTLDKMAQGGIYDVVVGGFSRYSVDGEWFAPHFEKMLYDNGQLLALYAQAYQHQQKPLYAQVIRQTIDFLLAEMKATGGGFYAALDADSEGVEGKFYTWPQAELASLLPEDSFHIFQKYFYTKEEGNWEGGRNILFRRYTDEQFCEQNSLSQSQLDTLKVDWFKRLKAARTERVRPQLDNKIITGWNALLLQGLCQSVQALQDQTILEQARQLGQFLATKLDRQSGLLHQLPKEGGREIPAFLEDYAQLVVGYLSLYAVSFEEEWLQKARRLADNAITKFYDQTDGLFFYTDGKDESLIARKKEIFDNVIPSSNATMLQALQGLAAYFPEGQYQPMAERMLNYIRPVFQKEVQYLSHWAKAFTQHQSGYQTIVVTGKGAKAACRKLQKAYRPQAYFAATETHSALAVFEGRIGEPLTYFICKGQTCELPVHTHKEAIEILDKM